MRKAASQLPHRVFRSVYARGNADYEERWAPFGHDALNGRKARPVVGSGDAGERVGKLGFEITDRDAGAPGAKVEGEDRTGPRRVMGDG